MSRSTGADQKSYTTGGAPTVRNYFPAYRVFIAGFEVTPICTSVVINGADKNPTQCHIELANPDKLMTLSESDIVTISAFRNAVTQTFVNSIAALSQQIYESQGLSLQEGQGLASIFPNDFGLPIDPETMLQTISAMGRGQVFFQPFEANLPPFTNDIINIKNIVVPPKLQLVYKQGTTGIDGKLLPYELFNKFPFVQGEWIWHFGDPVRVVFREPADPTTWRWKHAGTITDLNERETEDKQSILTLTSEGLLKDLRNARIGNVTGAFL